MAVHLIAFFIEVAVQTVFLALALWIMLLLQKLNYNFLGLLGTSALVSIVDQGLDRLFTHFLGFYTASSVSTPIVLAVLYFCLKKVTQADRTDIYFTVGIGYALVFAMNMWLFGALLGDLRPSARNSETDDSGTNDLATLSTATNDTPSATAKTNPPAHGATIPAAINSPFVIKGVTRNGDKSMVTVQSGTKTKTISLGEAVTMQTPDGPAAVRFKQLTNDTVVLTVDGKDMKLPVH